jgi:hypothetical protein
MALSRIWTAFIVIALLVAGGRFLMEPGQEQLFSHLATGKNTDTVSTAYWIQPAFRLLFITSCWYRKQQYGERKKW